MSDHRAVIDKYRGLLLDEVQLTSPELLDKLARYRVITSRQSHEIRMFCSTNARKVSAMLAFIRMKSEEDFEDFLTCLRTTGYLEIFALLSAETGMTPESCRETESGEPAHRHVIDDHWEALLGTDLHDSGLLQLLVRAGVIDLHEETEIKAYHLDDTRKTETLLYMLRKLPASDFQTFIQCLYVTGQDNIASAIAQAYGYEMPNDDCPSVKWLRNLKACEGPVSHLDHRACIDRNRPWLIEEVDLDNGDLMETLARKGVLTRKHVIELKSLCKTNKRKMSGLLALKRKSRRRDFDEVFPSLRQCNQNEAAAHLMSDYKA